MERERISPVDALRIWFNLPAHEERDRVVRFANALADLYLSKPHPRDRIPLSTLDLPSIAYGGLRRAGYQYVDEVENLSMKELQSLRNIGPLCAIKIRTAINKRLNRVTQ